MVTTTEYVLGIDEAGRGPVLGPLVFGCVYCPLSGHSDLRDKIGAKDSKQLSATEREAIYEKLTGVNILQQTAGGSLKVPPYGYGTRIISSQEISECMLRKEKYNLNFISHDSAIFLIRQGKLEIETKVKGSLKEVFMDTVGPSATLKRKLEHEFPDVTITVEPRADDKFPVVSAASIVAKVTRDFELSKLEKQHKAHFGSGYPSHPVTKRYLKDSIDPVFGYHHTVVRFSWATTRNALEENGACKMEWSDDDEEGSDGLDHQVNDPKQTKLSFNRRHPFFEQSGLKHVQQF